MPWAHVRLTSRVDLGLLHQIGVQDRASLENLDGCCASVDNGRLQSSVGSLLNADNECFIALIGNNCNRESGGSKRKKGKKLHIDGLTLDLAWILLSERFLNWLEDKNQPNAREKCHLYNVPFHSSQVLLGLIFRRCMQLLHQIWKLMGRKPDELQRIDLKMKGATVEDNHDIQGINEVHPRWKHVQGSTFSGRG